MGNAQETENSTIHFYFTWPTFCDLSDRVQMNVLVRGCSYLYASRHVHIILKKCQVTCMRNY